MKASEYIDEVKRSNGLDTDYKVAKLLGCRQQKISNWREGQTMDNETARQIAEILRIPVWQVIADMEAERQKDPAKKKAWKMLSKLSQQGGRATANLLFLLPFPALTALHCILC
jgi:transcriptional regulator with XRE-family HTH domain